MTTIANDTMANSRSPRGVYLSAIPSTWNFHKILIKAEVYGTVVHADDLVRAKRSCKIFYDNPESAAKAIHGFRMLNFSALLTEEHIVEASSSFSFSNGSTKLKGIGNDCDHSELGIKTMCKRCNYVSPARSTHKSHCGNLSDAAPKNKAKNFREAMAMAIAKVNISPLASHPTSSSFNVTANDTSSQCHPSQGSDFEETSISDIHDMIHDSSAQGTESHLSSENQTRDDNDFHNQPASHPTSSSFDVTANDTSSQCHPSQGSDFEETSISDIHDMNHDSSAQGTESHLSSENQTRDDNDFHNQPASHPTSSTRQMGIPKSVVAVEKATQSKHENSHDLQNPLASHPTSSTRENLEVSKDVVVIEKATEIKYQAITFTVRNEEGCFVILPYSKSKQTMFVDILEEQKAFYNSEQLINRTFMSKFHNHGKKNIVELLWEVLEEPGENFPSNTTVVVFAILESEGIAVGRLDQREKYKALSRRLAETYGKNLLVKEPEIGDWVLAPSKSKREYQRARVCEIEKPKHCRVQFLDTGKIFRYPLNQLLSLPEHSEPPGALRICPQLEGQFQTKAGLRYFYEELCERETPLTLVYDDHPYVGPKLLFNGKCCSLMQ